MNSVKCYCTQLSNWSGHTIPNHNSKRLFWPGFQLKTSQIACSQSHWRELFRPNLNRLGRSQQRAHSEHACSSVLFQRSWTYSVFFFPTAQAWLDACCEQSIKPSDAEMFSHSLKWTMECIYYTDFWFTASREKTTKGETFDKFVEWKNVLRAANTFSHQQPKAETAVWPGNVLIALLWNYHLTWSDIAALKWRAEVHFAKIFCV